jgi:effector-binding domain-containing protein
MTCGDVDASVFEQPEQVADGTFVEKTTPPMAVACLKHKGDYKKLNDTVGKLMKLMGKQKMAPAGPVMMTFLKGPPKVKKAKKYVTEICMPVMVKKPPKRPKKKGKLVLKGMKPMNVLSVYGSGDYQTKTGEMMKALAAEAKNRKLKTKGPACGVYYMDSTKYPPEQQVAELMIKVKGGKKKKAKKAKKAPAPKKKKVIKPIKKSP